MATCITKARSNYFSVTDVPAFLTIMQKWEKDFGIRIMKKRIDEDQTVYAFSYETTSVNINGALCDLQKILPEWEAVIIQENCLRAVVKRHDEICDWKSNNYYIQYHRHLGPFHACITKNP